MVHRMREALSDLEPGLWSTAGRHVEVEQDQIEQHQQSCEANNSAIVALVERSIGHARRYLPINLVALVWLPPWPCANRTMSRLAGPWAQQ
jgi:hypothetical protein